MSRILVVLAVIARLVPHPWNFTPVGAFGLFAGARMSPRTAWIVPIASLAISDLIVGGYNWIVMIGVYLGFMVGPLLGWLMLRGKLKAERIAGAVVANALLFFLISNFAVWMAGYYPMTASGLITCYMAGLPFLGVSLLGDGVYSFVLFGGYATIENRLPKGLRFA